MQYKDNHPFSPNYVGQSAKEMIQFRKKYKNRAHEPTQRAVAENKVKKHAKALTK